MREGIQFRVFGIIYEVCRLCDKNGMEILLKTVGEFYPQHILRINLIKISEKECLVSIKHTFMDLIGNGLIKKFTKFKNFFMKCLKRIFENL